MDFQLLWLIAGYRGVSWITGQTPTYIYIYIYMFYDVLSLFCHAMIMVVLGLVFGHSDRISTWTNNDGNMTQLQTREFKPQKHGDMMYGLQTKMTFLPKDIEISSNQEIGISANKHGDVNTNHRWNIMGLATATQISGMIVSVRWTDRLIGGGYPFCTFFVCHDTHTHTHTLDLKHGVSFRIQDFHNPRVQLAGVPF